MNISKVLILLILVGKHLNSSKRSGGHFEISEVAKISEKQWDKTTILTPVKDRFPAQPSNLKVFKFNGFSEPKDWRNVSAMKM